MRSNVVNRTTSHLVLGLSALVFVVGVSAGTYFATTGHNPPAPTTPAPEPPPAVSGDRDTEPPPPAPAKGPKLTGGWDSKVMPGKDPVSGASQVALAGRFVAAGIGPSAQPVSGDVTVDVYDLKPSDTSIEPRLLEEWLIEADNLPAFGRQEKEGFVLDLKLPWSSYRPELASVKLVVKFKLAQGPELTHEETISLDHSAVQTALPDGPP
jgi:hypothetical protein